MAVVITPKALQKCYQALYYKMLPLCGVNRNIEWSVGPCLKGTTGLVSQSSSFMLSPKDIHFLQRILDGNDSTSKMVRTIHESFMVEVGMYVNILSISWEEVNVLATKHTW